MPELLVACPSRLASLMQRCWNADPSKRPTFAVICKELRYLKFLLMIGGRMQFQALDPDVAADANAHIVQHLSWIDHRELDLVRHICNGGFGIVDECIWQGKRVAVRNLFKGFTRKRVEEEAALLERVKHPNVVKLIGCAVKEEEGKGMIVMELMKQDPHSLVSHVRHSRSSREPPFSLSVALDIILQVATAMKHIRECNVLHRDLKTTNILENEKTGSFKVLQIQPFSPRKIWSWIHSISSLKLLGAENSAQETYYDVILADFGLSKYKVGDSMFTTKASEAQLWRAPETTQARNYSWPADVFSFGVVCYEILSGEVSFKGMHGSELLKLLSDGIRPPIPTYCPRIVVEFVDACWATNPEDRPEFAQICMKLKTCIKYEAKKRTKNKCLLRH